VIKTAKIIKYFAIGFACFLIISIISLIMYGIISFGNIFFPSDNDKTKKEDFKVIEVSNNIESLDMEIIGTNIIIKGDTNLKIETNNKYIETKETNNKLSITETKHSLINNSDNSDLIIYIPSNYIFDNISIENGAGKIEAQTLQTKKLNLDLGAGKVDINNLTVTNNLDLDGGAGEIIITNGAINNLDLDMGVGKLTLTSIITGNSEIDAGIGDLELNLIGTREDYKIKLDKGIGNATLNQEKMKDNTYYGTGSNIIDISGGIGSIEINIINN